MAAAKLDKGIVLIKYTNICIVCIEKKLHYIRILSLYWYNGKSRFWPLVVFQQTVPRREARVIELHSIQSSLSHVRSRCGFF